ncbi:DMT family transporter [uncultured Roseovarius sp.]|uniref:DMT family transporter n=1 Tax=uncultured Roseovarius sp. TaxID=293344 RepID=UPI002607EDF7|nr:DMT family transporter [uncultured Roseovarius sp.]
MIPIRPINWLKIVVLAMIWGASFMFVSIALEGVGPLTLVATRLTLGAVFLVILCGVKGIGLPSPRAENGGKIWIFAIVMGLFSNAIPFTMLSWAQLSVASGFAGVCMAVVPLLVLPLAHVFVPGESMTLRRSIGFAIGTIGVIILIGPNAFASTGNDLESLARFSCVAASACYAIGSISTRLCPEVNMLSLSAAALCVASVVSLPLALIYEGSPSALNLKVILALLYLGILPTGVAQLLLTQVIRDAGPVFMSLVNYQVPLWSVVLGALVLAEPLPPSLLLGMVLILGGVALSQLGKLRRLFGRG